MIAWMPLHKEAPKEQTNVLIYTTYGTIYVARLWHTESRDAYPDRYWWRIVLDTRDLRYDEVTHWAELVLPEAVKHAKRSGREDTV